MERRALLSTLGVGAAALAGCTTRLPGGGGGQSPEPAGGTPTDTDRRVAMGESVTVDGATLLVANPRVHPTVVQDAGVWQSLRVTDGQYLVVDVTADGAVPERRDDVGLAGAVDGEALPESEPVLVVEGDDPGGPRSPREWNGRRVAFPFPAESHERASVHWERGGATVRWTLDESVRSALAAAPLFRVERLSARRTSNGDVALALTVANDGDRDARFQLWVSFEAIEDASSTVALDVPAGGTATYEAVPPILAYHGVETVTTAFRAGGEERRRDLPVAAPHETGTTTGTASATASETEP